MKTGALIVYTSADSVFQIAANEAIVPALKSSMKFVPRPVGWWASTA